MFSYYVIYYEKFRKVMQRTEKEVLNQEHVSIDMNEIFGELVGFDEPEARYFIQISV